MRKTRVLWTLSLVSLWGTAALAQEGLLAPFVDQDVPLDAVASAPLFAQLTPPDPTDVRFRPGDTVSFNVAVWEGGHGERGGQKSVSFNWWKLTLLPR